MTNGSSCWYFVNRLAIMDLKYSPQPRPGFLPSSLAGMVKQYLTRIQCWRGVESMVGRGLRIGGVATTAGELGEVVLRMAGEMRGSDCFLPGLGVLRSDEFVELWAVCGATQVLVKKVDLSVGLIMVL